MKIRKFNESNSNGLDIQYLKFIFSEFLDEGAEGFNRDGDKDEIEDYYEIFIKEPNIITSKDFDSYEKNIKKLYDFSNDIKSCIERVKDAYPDIKINFEFERVGHLTYNKLPVTSREIHILFEL
jgi:hypothetical protein